MAKGTRYGGASLTADESADPQSPQPVRVRRAEIGPMKREVKEVATSPGSSSNPSSEKEQKSNDATKLSRQRPAPMMESPFSQPEKVTDDTARSTVTDGRKTRRSTKSTDPFDVEF